MKFLLIALLLFSLHSVAQQVSSLPTSEFEKLVDRKEGQLLDVRRAAEYQSGHLPGALLADWTDRKQFEERVQYLDKTKPVYLYCLSGGRSAAAASWLAGHGFETVVNLDGGINAWRKDGKPLAADTVLQQMSDPEYRQLITLPGLVLVDFGAEWCPPCKKMEPILQEIQKAHKNLTLVKIDGGIQTGLMKQYGVEAVPAFILYKGGKEVWRRNGFTDKATFEQALRQGQ